MPLLIKSLKSLVSDWFLTTSTLGQDSVSVAMVTVRMAILNTILFIYYYLVFCLFYLLPVSHAGRELYQATIALEVFRVPAEVHSIHTPLQVNISNGWRNLTCLLLTSVMYSSHLAHLCT